MSDVDQAEIVRRLEVVEADTDPQRAEHLQFDVLCPFLEAEGYTVEHTGGPRDYGIDLLATVATKSGGLPSRVGIQYKRTRRRLARAVVQQEITAT